MAASEPAADESREDVLTFAGSGGRSYHRPVEQPALRGDEERLVAACGQTGRNPLLKDPDLIATHYDACAKCFPGHDDADE
ncbi:hypothetical protein [Halovivax cerinus]|uniref:Uncharacterized protein n=1 Tax=Halovivax cerinus TaxID=1487865 RepID=A0ABD5NKH6_9EURY|nr:hypothetical protein [Halovivax cerinus]